MKLLADENVKFRLVKWLNQSGHDCITADKGVKNSHLFNLASTMGRILLTNDTDFLNITLYPLANTPGRIVLRVFPSTFENQKASVAALLSQSAIADCQDKLIELWQDGFEIRKS